MPDPVKCFLNVQKNRSCVYIAVEVVADVIDKFYQLLSCRVIASEGRLFQSDFVGQVFLKLGEDDFFIDFRDGRE